MTITPWGIDDAASALEAAGLHVDGIISDDPAGVVAALDRSQAGAG
jgi:hypothetical protein